MVNLNRLMALSMPEMKEKLSIKVETSETEAIVTLKVDKETFFKWIAPLLLKSSEQISSYIAVSEPSENKTPVS